jgi:hypothetical protein
MVSQETKLFKDKRMNEFNEQFNDTVERGVFRKLTAKEIAEYSGPVNYTVLPPW